MGEAACAARSGCHTEDVPVSPAGEKPHKCELCDFTCRDVSYLSKHMLTHSNDKNFMCTECGYITKWKHYLNVHMRKHTGDLRYDPGLPWPGNVVRAPQILPQGSLLWAALCHCMGHPRKPPPVPRLAV